LTGPTYWKQDGGPKPAVEVGNCSDDAMRHFNPDDDEGQGNKPSMCYCKRQELQCTVASQAHDNREFDASMIMQERTFTYCKLRWGTRRFTNKWVGVEIGEERVVGEAPNLYQFSLACPPNRPCACNDATPECWQYGYDTYPTDEPHRTESQGDKGEAGGQKDALFNRGEYSDELVRRRRSSSPRRRRTSNDANVAMVAAILVPATSLWYMVPSNSWFR